MKYAARIAALGRAWATSVSRPTRRLTVVMALLVAAALGWVVAGPSMSPRLLAAAAQETDTDGDTMPDAWETFFGLNPSDPSDAGGDPDGDGLTNAQEFAAHRHPVGLHARYFAEGSTGFFDTSVSLLNLSATDTAHVAIALLNEAGGMVSHQVALTPRQRRTVSIDDVLGVPAAVAIIVESDVPVAADRFMTWGSSGIGASLDSGAPSPATTWYFAEGATGSFLLYYLFENPGTTPANVTVRYLVEGGAPVTTTRTLRPRSRTTVFVNAEDPALQAASVGSVVTSDVPIFAERAMYVLTGGTLGGGSASAGSNALATQWYFGEGSTGSFFHCFLSMLNPGTLPATATVTYHLGDGTTATKDYLVPAQGRRTVYFNGEAEADPALAGLAAGPVSFTVSSTQPILGERAMWWPDWPWYEGHAAPGSTTSDVSWAVADGRHGGATFEETYVLIGNTTTTPGQVRLTLIPDTGAPVTREMAIAAGERKTVNVGGLFGLTGDSRFSVVVDSLGTPPTPLAVDYARYRSVNGIPFSGGGAAPAIPVPPVDAAPTVTSTTPAANATGVAIEANLTVTFSEPVNAGAGAFVLDCPIGTPIALVNLTASPARTFTLDPTPDLPLNTVCRLRIVAAEITDVDTTDPPDTMAANVDVPFTTAACPTITVSPTVVPGGTINVAYAPVQFTQTGGTLPVTWSVTAGALPAGMTLSAAGALGGTPTASGPFTFTVTAADANACTGSAPLSLTVLIGPNQEPTFTPGGNQTVLEDAGPQSVAWATAISPGPAAEAGQVVTFNVTGNTNTGLFLAPPAISATGTLTYTTAPNANGTATITVVLQDNGGTAGGGDDTSLPATFTIAVTAVNDAPSFTVGANQTVLEDAGAQTVTGWATTISAGPGDETGQTLAFGVTTNTNPTLFSVAPAVSATGDLTYTPDANANGTATITLTLTDSGGIANGGADAVTAPSFTITVTAVNDPPLAVADAATTDEDTVLTAPAPGVLDNDLDPDAGDTRTVIAVNGVAANVGTPLTLASGATVTVNADGSVVYDPTAVVAFQALGEGDTATDSITYTMQDGGGLPSSATASVTIEGVNDVPALDLDLDNDGGTPPTTGNDFAVTFTESGPPLFIQDEVDATIGDVDSPNLTSITVTITNVLDPLQEKLDVDLVTGGFDANFTKALDESTPGVAVLTIAATTPQPLAAFHTLLRRVTYQNLDTAADTTAPRTITFVVGDGDGNSNTATTTVTITAVDDPPTADNDSYSVAEGGTLNIAAPGVLDGDADPEGDTPITAVLVTGPANASSFTLNSAGSFTYTHDGSETTTDSFTYRAVANGLQSAPATVTITITPVNDAPVVSAGTTITFTEGIGATPIATTLTATDVDDTNLESATVQITDNYVNGQDVLAFSSQSGITGVFNAATGTLTLTGSSSVANYEAALRTVTYFNGSNTPSQLTRTVTFVVHDGGLASAGATSTITVVAVNDAPVVVSETFELLGNTELRVDMTAGTTPHTSETTSGGTPVEGVLDNDSDPEGDPFAITGVTGCTDPDGVLPFDCTLPGGAVLHIAANGEFSYTPAPGATSGSFTYTVADTPAQGLPAAVTGTVTFTFFDMIWYVDADAPAGGNGTSRLPFNTLTATNLAGANGAGDLDDADAYLFVHSATAAISAGIELEAGQHLIGEPAGLSIPRSLNGNGSPTVVVAANAALALPVINGGAGNSVTVTEAMPAEIRGLTLGSLNAIDVTTDGLLTGAASLTIADNVINGATAEGIDVNLNAGTTGTLALAITGNSWNPAGTHAGNAVDIIRAAGTLNLNFSNNTNIKSNATAVSIIGGSFANANITGFANNSVSTDTLGAGVVISNVAFDAVPGGGVNPVVAGSLLIGVDGNPVGGAGMSLTTVQGALSFTDLDVYGGTSGLTVVPTASGLTLTTTAAGSGGSSEIKAANGAAVDISGPASLDLQLSELASTATAAGGVALSGVNGTFSALAGSTISKTSGAGTAFSVTGSALTLTYAGSLNVTSGAGVSLTSNAGSTITFSGGMTLNTGANAAFTATGGGTINVCDENPCNPAATGALVNTLTTTTATALNVANTTIGASGLTFRSINVDGTDALPTSGIVLNNTGAGGVTVTGTGAAGSGGTIQDTAGDGVSLTSTANTSLNWMAITSNLGSGIRGTTVNGFALSNSSITSNGNDAAADESGIFMTNLTGTASGGTNPTSLTNSTISNNNEFEIQITNTSGTLTNLTMSGNTISSNGLPINGNVTSPHGNLVNFLGTSTAVMTLTVTSGTFTGNWNPASPPATITGTAISAVNQGTSHTVNVSGSTFTNNNAGVDCSSDPIATTFTCVVSNNNFQGSRAVAINSFHNGNAPYTRTFNGTFTNNTIGTVGVAGSGSGLGNGISVQNEGAISDARYLISGNQIHQVTSFPAVSVNVGLGGLATGGGTTNVTITNNTISNIGSRGIAVQENQDPTLGPFPTVCANISGNSFANIAGQAGNGEFMRVRRLSGTVRVTQATPTAAANVAELDDANGFNNPALINVSGTVLFSQTACTTP